MKELLLQFKRLLLICLSFFMWLSSFSQGFVVRSFKQNINDGSAFHAPVDKDGRQCGLIKIRTQCRDLHFTGDIIGEVENKMNEYWVNVAPNSNSLNILHQNYLPLIVMYEDYGIDIVPKSTYVLTLEETKFKKEKNGVTIIIKPEESQLFIDGIIVDNLSGNGYYHLFLPKGEHVCKVSKLGFRPYVQTVHTGKGQQHLNIELESILADLEINCKTATAEIFVDGEFKGNGSWKGKVLAGEHTLEARQKSYNTISQIVRLEEKESTQISMPELKRSTAKINIVTSPRNIPLIVDGTIKGTAPLELELETGIHHIKSEAFGCESYQGEVVIEDGRENSISINIKCESEDYLKAYEGDKMAIRKLAIFHLAQAYNKYNDDDERQVEGIEAFFWAERHPAPEELLNYENDEDLCDEDYYDYWVYTYSDNGKPDMAKRFLDEAKNKVERGLYESRFQNRPMSIEAFNYRYIENILYIGHSYYRLKKYDEAIKCYEESEESGYEGLGDCYNAIGDNQKAAFYYLKAIHSSYNSDRIQKKYKNLRM